MIAVDTNLLVYAHRSATPEHKRAQRALESAAQSTSGWGLALPVLAEFWSVVTQPNSAGRPSTPEEARRFIRALIHGGKAQIWTATSGFAEPPDAAEGGSPVRQYVNVSERSCRRHGNSTD